jgi:aminomethyltransferase
MVDFAGFEMPVQYPTGITKEHEIVRNGVGVFDVSHMGEFEITGPDRNAFANRVTCNDVGALVDGQAQYSALLTDDGTFVDDCLVYRFDDKIMMVVNASNIGRERFQYREGLGSGCRAQDRHQLPVAEHQ